MFVVSFKDVTPDPRYDGIPWTSVDMEEAPTADGTWSVIDTFSLAPYDTDPKNPRTRSFTSENATQESGLWYRFTFNDDLEHVQQSTEPLLNTPDVRETYKPTISKVASLMRSRTTDSMSNEIGTFTGTEIPESLWSDARTVIAMSTAASIELSYFPEQVISGRSPYEQYRAQTEMGIGRLTTAIERETALASGEEEDVGGPGMPHFSFPDNEMIGLRTIW
jgi:hypothetical protein